MVLHNPNNWHWVNKDVSAWARDYLQEKLSTISAEEDGVTAKIEKVLSMDGDVDVSQRKGKVITLFDVKLQLEYEGTSLYVMPFGIDYCNPSTVLRNCTDRILQVRRRKGSPSVAPSTFPRLPTTLRRMSMLYVPFHLIPLPAGQVENSSLRGVAE